MKLKIFDVHTHAFPDFLAPKAMELLSETSKPYLPSTDGTSNGLLASMDDAGVEKSFIANIATNPEQTDAIIKWSKDVMSDRLIPLGSIHPKSNYWQKEIEIIKEAGFPGIKLHSMYQNFSIDDEAMYPIYEYIAFNDLFILFHAGHDIAFPDDNRAMPYRFKKLIKDFPSLHIIAAHCGGWHTWEAVAEELVGMNIFLDTSFIDEVDKNIVDKILRKHDKNRLLFGSDSPWQNQKNEIQNILKLNINDDFKENIFYKNIQYLL